MKPEIQVGIDVGVYEWGLYRGDKNSHFLLYLRTSPPSILLADMLTITKITAREIP